MKFKILHSDYAVRISESKITFGTVDQNIKIVKNGHKEDRNFVAALETFFCS